MQGLSVIGAGLILGAFLALQRRWWASHDARYLWANFVGASLLAIVAIWDRRIGFIVLEVAWAAVALASLFRRKPVSG
jgi:hypothetical protein